jgi:hypothetical protein
MVCFHGLRFVEESNCCSNVGLGTWPSYAGVMHGAAAAELSAGFGSLSNVADKYEKYELLILREREE